MAVPNVPKHWSTMEIIPQSEVKQFLREKGPTKHIGDVVLALSENIRNRIPKQVNWIFAYGVWLPRDSWTSLYDYVYQYVVGGMGMDHSVNNILFLLGSQRINYGICAKNNHTCSLDWFIEDEPCIYLPEGIGRLPAGSSFAVNQRWHSQVYLCKIHERPACSTCNTQYEFLSVPAKFLKSKTDECPSCLSTKLMYSTQDVKAKGYFRKASIANRIKSMTWEPLKPPVGKVLVSKEKKINAGDIIPVEGQNVVFFAGQGDPQQWAGAGANYNMLGNNYVIQAQAAEELHNDAAPFDPPDW